MPVLVPRRTPGVYVTELDSFPPSVIGVQTAVPAFIGYTQKAELSGKPVLNKPIRIGSLADFEEIFGLGFKAEYTIDPVEDQPLIDAGEYDFSIFDPDELTEKYYSLTQTNNSRFNLYNSMRLFYANGGGNCFVVSVGRYRDGNRDPVLVNVDNLQEGLNVIHEESGPTILVVPDAVLLPNDGDENAPWISADFQAITRAMLNQCAELQDRVSILDVYGTEYVDKNNLTNVIGRFREDVGVDTTARSYGMAYFPFLDTTVVPLDEVNYTNIADSALATLQQVLSWQNINLYSEDVNRYPAIQADIDAIAPGGTPEEITKLDQNLSAMLPLMVEIKRVIVSLVDQLPSSGAMAGVFTFVDQTRGVFNAPANVVLNAVDKPTYQLDAKAQGDLNVPVDGKAVDAIREFKGRGTVVWGARTLDGNSNDYRYIQVRRTLIYIEQSIKLALEPFVFAANDGNTWTKVVSLASGFLQGLWSQGGLMGATASEAFNVECGLGSTMTATDILEGYMIVQVTLQMVRPAEFIELTFKQKLEG